MRGLALRRLPAAHVAVGAVVLVLGGAVWTLGALQARRRSRPDHARERAEAADLWPIAIGTAVVGVAAFLLGAFFPG